jgi:hypothetical protein
MIKFLAIPTVLLALASTSVVAQVTNGRVDIEDNDGSSLFDAHFAPVGTPLLSRFAFELDGDKDNHLKQILIAPFPQQKMRLDFSDKDANNLPFFDDDDDYFFNVTHFDILDSRVQRFTRSLDICSEQGICTVQLNKPAGDFVFVLIGFQLSFRNNFDHHINEVKIMEDDGMLTVAFNDKHFDPSEDTFLWSLDFAYVPRDQFVEIGESSAVKSKDEVPISIPQGRAVLRGFRFKFQPHFTDGNDHHLKKIGILPTTAGTALISYRDKNGDDGYDWIYRWGILKTRIIKWPPGLEPPVVNPSTKAEPG